MRSVSLLLSLFLLFLSAASAVSAASAASAARPNFLYILADDLEADWKQSRLDIMPNLKKLIKEQGATFENYVAAYPVCGPSRSSFLAGRYPHNTGYVVNDDPASVAAWTQEENNTLGTWLTHAGYHTAFFGKYINGMETHIPGGWRHWAGFSSGKGTYNYYNATIYNASFTEYGQLIAPITDTPMTGTHQADFLGQFALRQVHAAVEEGRPFYVQVNPVMVHWGVCYSRDWANDDPYWEQAGLEPFGCTQPRLNNGCKLPISPCASHQTRHLFDKQQMPLVPSWNSSVTSGAVPADMANLLPLTAYEQQREEHGWRNRSAAAVDLDRMIGVLVAGLQAEGVLDNTYVIFTSDNGYHLGEHRLVFGKSHPYSTDVQLPFYIRGPGIPANVTRLHPANHIDTTATIVDLSGAAPVGPPLDGLSYRAALSATPTPAQQWRNYSFSEYLDGNLTWWALRFPLQPASSCGQGKSSVGERNSTMPQDQAQAHVSKGGKVAAEPERQQAEIESPSVHGNAFHWWCDGTAEVFDMKADPWQLANIAATGAGHAIVEALLPLAYTLGSCSGTQACSASPSAPFPTPPPIPLKCAPARMRFDGTAWDVYDP